MTREEAIQALAGLLSEYCSDCPRIYEEKCDCEAQEAIDMAIKALSADSVVPYEEYRKLLYSRYPDELVRCKDCKHRVYTKDGESNPHDIVCDFHMSDGFDETDFCSFGERRDNG